MAHARTQWRTPTRRGALSQMAILAAMGIGGGFTAQAQAQQPAGMRRVCEIKVKNGGQFDFEEAQKVISAAYKKAGMPNRSVWRSTLFGEYGVYFVSASSKDYAAFDAGSVLNNVTSAERARYTTLSQNSVQHQHCWMIQAEPSMSIDSGRTEPPKYARLLRTTVRPGKRLEFEDMIKTTVVPALKKGGYKDVAYYRSLMGATTGEYSSLTMFDKWSDLDALPSIEKALGSDGYKQYMVKVANTIDRSETMVIQYVPELSYR